MASGLPAPLAAFIDGLKKVAPTAAPVLGGFAAAKVGGALARLIPPVDDFANGSPFADAGVELGAGLLLDAGACVGVYAATSKEPESKRLANVAKVGGLLAAGTVVGASTDVIAPGIAKIIEAGTNALGGLLGGGSPKPAGGYPQLGAGNVGGLYDVEPPGGLDDIDFPGGGNDSSAWLD